MKIKPLPLAQCDQDERMECKIEGFVKLESCETPIEVLVAPDGQILGTSMKYEFEEKPHVMAVESGGQCREQQWITDKFILPNTNMQLFESDRSLVKTEQEDKTNTEMRDVLHVSSPRNPCFKYRCKICQVWFARAHLLAKHMKNHRVTK